MSASIEAMRLVAVTRVRNEADIIEAFVRHTASFADHHVLLDNGSTDRTLDILQALRAEGLGLSVWQTPSPHYCEQPLNTALFQVATGSAGADWVLFLDCDEFVDLRRAPGGLRQALATVAPDVLCFRLPIYDYHPQPEDDAADLLVPRRIRHREPASGRDHKVFVRGGPAAAGLVVTSGNHGALRDGRPLPAHPAAEVALAHYHRRSPWQIAAKHVIGRLKVIATGQALAASNISHHYTAVFETIRKDPAALLRDPGFLAPPPPAAGLVDDPVGYAGGPLRHTLPDDPLMQSIASVVGYAEALAVQHGKLLDTNEGARLQVHNLSLTWTRLT